MDQYKTAKLGGVATTIVGVGLWQGMRNPAGLPIAAAGAVLTLFGGMMEAQLDQRPKTG